GQQRQDPRVTAQLRKFAAQVGLDVRGVVRLERPVARLLEENGDGHDPARMQPSRPPPLAAARGQQLPIPPRRELDPELVYGAEQFEYTHGRTLLALGTVDHVL